MIAIIDYGIGNLASITNALNRLSVKSKITADLDEIKKAGGLILPGVGNAGEGMKNLKERKLDKLIKEEIQKGKSFLGICLGMQLLFEKSEEGSVECLGILKGMVKKFQKERKIPQIGWNRVKLKILFKNIPDKSFFYFVNSYYCVPEDKSIVAAETEYGEEFASIIVKDNIVATQFHPEKSGRVGYQLLYNIIHYFNDLNH
ncbi:imidazole glycerol phosphate synthase subunit HisH [Candidatus Gottesmanbacteria bacterium]|nr:imidazole glycerol phosphate synthase subunit HisH [Candidatus Gottesmanbacteria bacterium]